MINCNEIGLCKALGLDGEEYIGRLLQTGDTWHLATNIIEVDENDNKKRVMFNSIQVRPETVCAYTYMNDKYNSMVFEFDVLSLDNSDLMIYVYFDTLRGTFLYHTNRTAAEEETMERLNINELTVIGNITRDEVLANKFAEVS